MFNVLALSLTITIAAATPAAKADEAALAVKLAQAVASSEGRVGAKVYVGALPPGFAVSAPLPKYSLLGSVVQTPERMSPTPVLYYELPANAQNALNAYAKQLTASGWRAVTFLKRLAVEESNRGGFAITQPSPEYPDTYCNQKGNVVAVARLRSMPQVVALAFGGGSTEMVAFCAMSSAFAAIPTPAPAPTLPTLRPPDGATMESGNNVRYASSESAATVTSALPVAAVGQDFARQLTAGGWSADDAAQSSTAYVQTFRMLNKGHHYYAVLSLLSSGKPQTYNAVLKASDLDARPGDGFGFSFPFFP